MQQNEEKLAIPRMNFSIKHPSWLSAGENAKCSNLGALRKNYAKYCSVKDFQSGSN